MDETDDLAAFLDSVTSPGEEETPQPVVEVPSQPVVEDVSTGMSTDDGLDDIFGLGEDEPTPPQPVEVTPTPTVVEDLGAEDLTDGFLESLNPQPEIPVTPDPVETTPLGLGGGDDDIEDFLESSGLQVERDVPDITKPWMKFHEFVRVTTPEEVEAIVEAAIKDGHCSLDLETEGLDNRIRYRKTETGEEKPYTVHKIVGYCISIGDAKTGYYIPVGHRIEEGCPDLNVKPLSRVEAAITHLCREAQPIPKPGCVDPLGFNDMEVPPRVVIEFWHASFDQEFLYPITGIDWWHPEGFEDGMLAAFVLYSDDFSYELKEKAEAMLRDPEGHPYEMIKLKELFVKGRKIDFSTLSPDEPGVIKYACSDAICTRLLCHQLVAQAREAKFRFTYRLEKQVSQVKRVMERYRVKINREKIQVAQEETEKKREEYRSKIIALALSRGFKDFEPGSPKQLAEFLFSDQGLNITLSEKNKSFPDGKPEKTKSGQFKTDTDTFEALIELMGVAAPPVLEWVIAYRKEDKVLGTYLHSMNQNLDENDELRFSFKQHGAATGRFSAPAGKPEHGYSGIPIHGIPATSVMRTCFEARVGYVMAKCDYAGQELRIVTNLCHEPVWVKEFMEGDGDLHTITARAFFGKQEVTKEERKGGKIANFALIYGGGPASIMRATGCNRPEAQRRKQAFDKSVPVFATWLKNQHARVKKELGVYNAFRRWIAIPDANIKPGDTINKGTKRERVVEAIEANALKASCERKSVNYPVQSSGADIMKICMVFVHKQLHKRGWLKNGGDDSVRMLLSVHDELVFEIKPERLLEALGVIVTEMERPDTLPVPKWQVPLVVDPVLGTSWGDDVKCRKNDGKPIKQGEHKIGKFVFSKCPDWLAGIQVPVEVAPDEPVEVALKVDAPTPGVVVESPSDGQVEAPIEESEGVPKEEPQAQKDRPKPKVAVIKLKQTSALSVGLVRGAIGRWLDPDGVLIHLICGMTHEVLVDQKLGIRVELDPFVAALLELNLSDGRFADQV